MSFEFSGFADIRDGIKIMCGFAGFFNFDRGAGGHQPMHSDGGRYVLAFNGEIYNHLELRAELEGMDCRASLAMTDSGDGLPRTARNDGGWRGHSDTETLLAGFEAWGVVLGVPAPAGDASPLTEDADWLGSQDDARWLANLLGAGKTELQVATALKRLAMTAIRYRHCERSAAIQVVRQSWIATSLRSSQ